MAQKLTAINTFSEICEVSGGNIDEVAKCVGMDTRVNSKFMKSSIGFGGYCLEKDVKSLIYLAESLHLDMVGNYWRTVLEFNRHQMKRFGEKIIDKMDNNLKDKHVLFLGAAFKAETGDCRNSPVFEILKVILHEAGVKISVFDPYVQKVDFEREYGVFFGKEIALRIEWIERTTEWEFMFKEINAVCLVTDHLMFKDKDELFMKLLKRDCLIFDGRRTFKHNDWKQNGFEIYSVGIYSSFV